MTTTLLPSDRQTFVAPTIYTLANGVRVIAEQIPVDAVTLDIWTNVGSVDKSDDINGMAHPEFQRERMVVLEEIRRSDDNPDRRLYKHTSEMAYQYLPYRRPVLGLSEVIERLTSDQMRAFHRQWYRPENITVAVVGNISVARAIALGNRL